MSNSRKWATREKIKMQNTETLQWGACVWYILRACRFHLCATPSPTQEAPHTFLLDPHEINLVAFSPTDMLPNFKHKATTSNPLGREYPRTGTLQMGYFGILKVFSCGCTASEALGHFRLHVDAEHSLEIWNGRMPGIQNPKFHRFCPHRLQRHDKRYIKIRWCNNSRE